jgi:hypothetical protein
MTARLRLDGNAAFVTGTTLMVDGGYNYLR